MEITIVTKEELEEFRLQLLDDIRKIITPSGTKVVKPSLKNAEVTELLGISSNTLQRIRVSGKLPASKLGGIHFYKYEDIEKLLNSKAA